MTKPATDAPWATDTNYAASTQPWANTATKVQPPSATQTQGHSPEDPGVAQYENWWKNLVGQWTTHLNGTFTLIGRQVISAAGTYTPTTGTRAVRLRMIGGGGGGGSASSTGAFIAAAGGGASGIWYENWINPGALVTGGAVAIGAAGAGGTTGGNSGGGGGDTTIVIQGTTYTAKGGVGGSPMNLTGAGPAAASGGTISTLSSAGDIVRGDRGLPGMVLNGSIGITGAGGAGWGVAGAPQLVNSAAQAGAAATGNGSGGSGGSGYNSTSAAGGAGTAGLIIVEEYA